MRVLCNYDRCGCHRENPARERVEVPDGHEGPAYCSITCAVLAGALKLRAAPAADNKGE